MGYLVEAFKPLTVYELVERLVIFATRDHLPPEYFSIIYPSAVFVGVHFTVREDEALRESFTADTLLGLLFITIMLHMAVLPLVVVALTAVVPSFLAKRMPDWQFIIEELPVSQVTPSFEFEGESV